MLRRSSEIAESTVSCQTRAGADDRGQVETAPGSHTATIPEGALLLGVTSKHPVKPALASPEKPVAMTSTAKNACISDCGCMEWSIASPAFSWHPAGQNGSGQSSPICTLPVSTRSLIRMSSLALTPGIV